MARTITNRETATLAAAVLMSTFVATSAGAQDLSATISCIKGHVGKYDYAELTANFRESMWDGRAGVKLYTDGEPLTLLVLDTYGQSICDSIADNGTSCRFNLNYNSDFVVRIDNTERSTEASYRLCAH